MLEKSARMPTIFATALAVSAVEPSSALIGELETSTVKLKRNCSLDPKRKWLWNYTTNWQLLRTWLTL